MGEVNGFMLWKWKAEAAACSEASSLRQSAPKRLGARQGKGRRCCRAEKISWMTFNSHPRLLSMQ